MSPVFKSSNEAAPEGASSGGGRVDHLIITKPGIEVRMGRLPTDFVTTRFRIIPAWGKNEETGAVEELIHLNPALDGMSPAQLEDFSWAKSVGQTVFITDAVNGIGFPETYTYLCSSRVTRGGDIIRNAQSPTRLILGRIGKYEDYLRKRRENNQALPRVPASWMHWTEGKYSDTKKLSSVMLVQCWCYSYANEPIKPALPMVLVLSSSALKQFINSVRIKQDPEKPHGLSNNMLGDFCSMTNGRVCSLQRNGNNYSISLAQEPSAITQDQMKTFWKPWADILQFPCVEDQIDMILNAFGTEAVAYGLRGSVYEQFLPETCRGADAGIEELESLKNPNQQQSQTSAPAMQQPAAPSDNTEMFWVNLNGQRQKMTATQICRFRDQKQDLQVYKDGAWTTAYALFGPPKEEEPPPPPVNDTPPPPPTDEPPAPPADTPPAAPPTQAPPTQAAPATDAPPPFPSGPLVPDEPAPQVYDATGDEPIPDLPPAGQSSAEYGENLKNELQTKLADIQRQNNGQ